MDNDVIHGLLDIQEEFNVVRDQLDEAIARQDAAILLIRASQERVVELRKRIAEAQAARVPGQNLDVISAELVAAAQELQNSSAHLDEVMNEVRALTDRLLEVGQRANEMIAKIQNMGAPAQEVGFIPDPPQPPHENNHHNTGPMRGGRRRRVTRRRANRSKITRRRQNY